MEDIAKVQVRIMGILDLQTQSFNRMLENLYGEQQRGAPNTRAISSVSEELISAPQDRERRQQREGTPQTNPLADLTDYGSLYFGDCLQDPVEGPDPQRRI